MRSLARLMRRIGIEAVPHPTLRGIALLAAGVAAFAGAFIAGRREFLFIGVALLALPLLAAAWLVIARVRLHVERTFTSEVVESGTATTVTVSVANSGSMPTPRSWVLDLVPGSDGATPPVELPSMRCSRADPAARPPAPSSATTSRPSGAGSTRWARWPSRSTTRSD